MRQEKISLYLHEDLLKWVDEEAKKNGLKRNTFIVMILTQKKNEIEAQKGREVGEK